MLLAPEIGTSEILIIAAIALIVVGPKDLPVLLKRFGQLVGRMRNMAADFRASFEDMARQSELDDLRKEVEAMRTAASNHIAQENQAITEHLNAGFEQDQSFDAYADIFPPPPLDEAQLAAETAPAEAAKPPPKKKKDSKSWQLSTNSGRKKQDSENIRTNLIIK